MLLAQQPAILVMIMVMIIVMSINFIPILDQHGSNPEKLCKCGIVVDDDCFFTACDSSLDVYSKQSDGPCSYETTTVESVINNYAICKDGLVSDLNG